MNDLEKRYRIDESQFFYDYADGLAIIINSTTGIYYGINIFGSAIYHQLVQGASPASILEQLRHLPSCPAEIESLLIDFIARLQNFNLLIAEEQSGLIAHPFDKGLAMEEFLFEVEEFADIQEILLADPIHDVDSDYGWPVLNNQTFKKNEK